MAIIGDIAPLRSIPCKLPVLGKRLLVFWFVSFSVSI